MHCSIQLISAENRIRISGKHLEKLAQADGSLNAILNLTPSSIPGRLHNRRANVTRSDDAAKAARMPDKVICVEQLRTAMMASNCVSPGVFPLLFNLWTTRCDTQSSLLGDAHKEWEKEYLAGWRNQIYRRRLSPSFSRMSFKKAVQILQKLLGVIMIGFDVGDNILINPISARLPAIDEPPADAGMLAQRPPGREVFGYFIASDPSTVEMVTVLEKSEKPDPGVAESYSEAAREKNNSPPSASGRAPMAGAQKGRRRSLIARNCNTPHDNIANQRTCLDWVANYQLHETERCGRSYHVVSPPCRYKDAILYSIDELLAPGASWNTIPRSERPMLLCGFSSSSLASFVRLMRSKVRGWSSYDFVLNAQSSQVSCSCAWVVLAQSVSTTARAPLVILQSDLVPPTIWNKIAPFENVYFINGNPLDHDDLMRAGAHVAQKAVLMVLRRGQDSATLLDKNAQASMGENAALQLHGREEDILVDSESIFAYSAMRSINPEIRIILELVHQANIP